MLLAERSPHSTLSPQRTFKPLLKPIRFSPQTMFSPQRMFSPHRTLSPQRTLSPHRTLSPQSTFMPQAVWFVNTESPHRTFSPHSTFCTHASVSPAIVVYGVTPVISHGVPAGAEVFSDFARSMAPTAFTAPAPC